VAKKIDVYGFLGMPRGASQDDLRKRCEELLTWLRSDSIPAALKPWAREQASIAEGFRQGLMRVEEEEEEADANDVSFEVAPPRRTANREGPGLWGQLVRSPLFFAGMGVLVGGVILAGVLLAWDRLPSTAAPATSDGGTTESDAAKFLASQSGRIKQLEAQIAQTPFDVAALFELGEIYWEGQEWGKAILWLGKLLEIQPDHEQAQIDLALAYWTTGDFGNAETWFKNALESNPDSARVHYSLGFMYISRPNPDTAQAVKHWQEVLRLEPDTDLGKTAKAHLEQVDPLLLTPFTSPTPAVPSPSPAP